MLALLAGKLTARGADCAPLAGKSTLIRGKRRDLGLGSLSLTSLAEARVKARASRKIAREGGNPLEAGREAGASSLSSSVGRNVG